MGDEVHGDKVGGDKAADDDKAEEGKVDGTPATEADKLDEQEGATGDDDSGSSDGEQQAA